MKLIKIKVSSRTHRPTLSAVDIDKKLSTKDSANIYRPTEDSIVNAFCHFSWLSICLNIRTEPDLLVTVLLFGSVLVILVHGNLNMDPFYHPFS